MLSVSLIVVSLAAGLCYGRNSNDFSDCATATEIVTHCATDHLGYLKTINQTHYVQMQRLGMITMPNILVPILDNLCSDKMHLKEYYQCIYSNMTTCLKNENSTQVMGMPDANTVANGIVEMCDKKEAMNKTCIMTNLEKAIVCFGEFVNDDAYAKPCIVFGGLIGCADEPMSACDGGDAVKDFMVSARPHGCPYTSSVQRVLASGLLLVVMLLVHFIRME